MIASTASASETENTIFTIVWPTRHLMVKSEGDWRVSFAKCVTSASGAGRDRNRPATSLYQEESGELSPESEVDPDRETAGAAS
jgi:hypothetical protein